MKRLALIFCLALFIALLVHDAYEFFVTNQGLRYYSSEPRRLLYVLGLAIGGGVAAFIFSRFSPRAQCAFKLAALGLLASVLSGFVVLFAFHSLGFRELLTVREFGMLTAAPLLFGGLAVCLWFEFVHVWKTGRTRLM